MSHSEALQHLSGRIASVELSPYRSKSFRDLTRNGGNELRSSTEARLFVEKFVLPRARSGEILLLVPFGQKHWKRTKKQFRWPPNAAAPSKARGVALGDATECGTKLLEWVQEHPKPRTRRQHST